MDTIPYRYMFWTDLGIEPKIERASMDGSDRRVLHHIGLAAPTGITIDYQDERIYWTDFYLGTIERSNLDGSGRVLLIAGSFTPFSLTINDNLIFWTDRNPSNFGINVAHKLSTGSNVLYRSSRGDLFGIEAVNPNHQPQDSICSPPSLSPSLSISISLFLSL
jgi:hypothetical protein